MEARLRAQEAAAKKDAERHQKALDSVQERLQGLLEEKELLKAANQARKDLV